MKTIVQTISEALRLVRKGWTQGPQARTKMGGATFANSRQACSWCLYGALLRAGAEPNDESFHLVHSLLPPKPYRNFWRPSSAVIHFNERRGRTKAQVVAVLRRALAKARREDV